ARIDVPRSEFRVPRSIIDAHVHFWDPAELHYPWLEGVPSLGRPFLPSDYGAATGEIPIARVVFVECNCPPEEAGREVAFVERSTSAARGPQERVLQAVGTLDGGRGAMAPGGPAPVRHAGGGVLRARAGAVRQRLAGPDPRG